VHMCVYVCECVCECVCVQLGEGEIRSVYFDDGEHAAGEIVYAGLGTSLDARYKGGQQTNLL
jgi:hypothetical protein